MVRPSTKISKVDVRNQAYNYVAYVISGGDNYNTKTLIYAAKVVLNDHRKRRTKREKFIQMFTFMGMMIWGIELIIGDYDKDI